MAIAVSMSSLPSTSLEVPPEFSSCPSAYKQGDDKYINCPVSPGTDPCDLLRDLHRAKDFRGYFLVALPVIFSVLAFILNILFLFLQWRVWREAGSGHRKRYSLILFRSVTSCLTIILLYVVLIIWKTSGFNYAAVTVFIFIGSHDFLAIASTYVALTVLLYTAIVHPLTYRLSFRLCHCLLIIGGIYAVTVPASILIGIYSATLFYPDTGAVECEYWSCQYPLAISLVVLLSLGFVSVLVLYGLLLVRMRRRTLVQQSSVVRAEFLADEGAVSQKSVSSAGPNSSSVMAMNRLAINMVTFAVATLPLVAVVIYALTQLENLKTLGQGEKNPCKTFIHGHLFVEVELLASAVALIWLSSMVADPIVNTLADPRLSVVVKDYWRRLPCSKITCRVCRKEDKSVDEE